MRKSVRKIRCKKWLAGLAVMALLSAPAMKATAETDMGPFMQSIGVPASDVLYFGWSPIVAPTDPGQLALEDRLNFGLAMYEYGGKLQFTFVNGETSSPTIASIITGIYFDDGSLTEAGKYFDSGTVVPYSGGDWTSQSGVSFSFGNSGAPNWTLPEGANTNPVFDVTDTISLERNGSVDNGVNAIPEYLTVSYDYVGLNTFNDIVSTFLNGTSRIGMHVQGIGTTSFSESILWTPITDDVPPPPGPQDNVVVPLPGAAGLGLLGMALVARFRKKAQK